LAEDQEPQEGEAQEEGNLDEENADLREEKVGGHVKKRARSAIPHIIMTENTLIESVNEGTMKEMSWSASDESYKAK
jgi:hypothetical protein